MNPPATTREESWFFQGTRPFETLRRSILPDLIARRSRTRRLRIWSVGRSNGQEPYSLALVLRDDFPELASWDVLILASDLSTERGDRARRGQFTQAEVNCGLPARLLIKSFHRDGLTWTIDEPTRRLVEFHAIDLAGPWPGAGEFDLIAIRNLLPNLDPDTQRSTLYRLARAVAPDGYLWLGTAETPIDPDAPFERVEPDRAGFYRPRRTSTPCHQNEDKPGHCCQIADV